jgi:hypothetical protein
MDTSLTEDYPLASLATTEKLAQELGPRLRAAATAVRHSKAPIATLNSMWAVRLRSAIHCYQRRIVGHVVLVLGDLCCGHGHLVAPLRFAYQKRQ